MPFNKCTAEPVSRDPKLEVFLKAWDFLAKAKAYVFSFHKLEGFKNLHVLFRKRRSDTQGIQTQKLQHLFTNIYKDFKLNLFSRSQTSMFGLLVP